jgi:hypothetical protein
MDLKSLDKEAEAAALKEIQNMFQRSGHLEKIDTYRHRVQRKMITDEALLKSGNVISLPPSPRGLREF